VTTSRFENVGKFTKPQLALLRALAAGPAPISNRTVAEPSESRRVGQAVWAFAYGSLRSYGLVTTRPNEWDDRVWMAEITDVGREYLAWLDAQIPEQSKPSAVPVAPKVAEALSMIWCPVCGKNGCRTMKSGCDLCGATAEDIERLEPGPWSDWELD
jgi:DNA-binding MarR family transcriptional regulator